MKTKFNFLFGILLSAFSVYGQQCPIPVAQSIFHPNEIRTTLRNNGNFFASETERNFQVPFQNPESPSSIYTAGIWLGGFDDFGSPTLHTAVATYGGYSNNVDFVAGPLEPFSNPTLEDCSNWDRIWTVMGFEIQQHLADYYDNFIIDDPLLSILSWPGNGNPHFAKIHGFELPSDIHGLAPFYDFNGNGIYEPAQGRLSKSRRSYTSPDLLDGIQ